MSRLMLGLVGDIHINRDEPVAAFRDVRALLDAPDILFGNLEGGYTDHPVPVPSAIWPLTAPSHNLDHYGELGFDVLSMANNHVVDVGYEVMLENRARLETQGVRICGIGIDIATAHQPAVLDVQGQSVAYLGYSSTFPVGYEARKDRPGLAPVRAYDVYRQPYPNNSPGRVPIVTTVADEEDYRRLAEDVRKASTQFDLVVVSVHWGDHTRPYHITDHEMRTARYCCDLGADIVVGHHHHSLRGIEWYDGKPILYGLGHFVFDHPIDLSEEEIAARLREVGRARVWAQDDFAAGPRPGWPLLPMHEDTRMTVFAWAQAERDHVIQIGIVPCVLTADGLVHPADPDSKEGSAVVRYLDRCNESQGLDCRFTTDDAPVIAGHRTLRAVPR